MFCVIDLDFLIGSLSSSDLLRFFCSSVFRAFFSTSISSVTSSLSSFSVFTVTLLLSSAELNSSESVSSKFNTCFASVSVSVVRERVFWVLGASAQNPSTELSFSINFVQNSTLRNGGRHFSSFRRLTVSNVKSSFSVAFNSSL